MTESNKEIVPLSDATIKMFAQMAGSLEEYVPEGGGDSIIQQILSATSVDEYNAAFAGRQMPNGVDLKVVSVKYAPSTFKDGLPFYLVVDCMDVHGEVKTYITGATSVVAALTRAAYLDQLPVIGEAKMAEKETASGYRPVNWVMKMVDIKPAKAAK